jgi:hypothetical protein
VKVDGSARSVLRQLRRYAKSGLLVGLVLVTNRARHQFPEEIEGIPLTVVGLYELR